MWQAIKKYNWTHLISDLIVILMTTALTFLLERLRAVGVDQIDPTTAGGLGFVMNRIRHMV